LKTLDINVTTEGLPLKGETEGLKIESVPLEKQQYTKEINQPKHPCVRHSWVTTTISDI